MLSTLIIIIIIIIIYKRPVYKQLALGWQIAKELSGLNPLFTY